MRFLFPLTIVVMAISNCTPMPGVSSNPDRVPDGIYSFEQQTISDNCQPAKVSGDRGQVGVTAYDSGYILSYEDFGTVQDEFPWSGSTKTVTFSAIGCDAGVEIELSKKMLSAGSRLEASLIRKYTVPSGCNPSSSSPQLPASSCVVEQKLRYSMVTPCEQPCLMKVKLAPMPDSESLWAADGGRPRDTVTCECP